MIGNYDHNVMKHVPQTSARERSAILIQNECDVRNIFTEIINDKVHSEWTISDFVKVILPVDGRASLGAGISAGRLMTI